MLIKINRDIPLIGCIAFGIIDRGTNLLQVRATSVCNINCPFCSVDGGSQSKTHENFYEVDCDYLVEEIAKVVEFKGDNIEINIDSVGEPFCYPELEKLTKNIRKIKGVNKISIQTNGTLYKDVDVDIINLSLHSMDSTLAKELSGSPCFNLELLKTNAQKWKDKGIQIRLCPVWVPKINDEELPKIIQYAKENNFELGIQKYEVYKHSRKIKKVKALNWWKFYKQLELWEKEFDIKLRIKAKDLDIQRVQRLPEMFKKGEKILVELVCQGWNKGQMIGIAKDRCISINDCDKEIGDLIKVKILESSNNIYLAE
ncbi:MAG: radical SAM protein [Nanoarchaeota archaeon]|nr:radical SAM protein [Nanoarchaeota archaeon]